MKKVLDIASSVAIIILAGFGVYNFTKPAPQGGARPKTEAPKELVSLAGAEIRGNKDAKVVLIVFSDFECPFCGKFATGVLPAIEKNYGDKIQVAFRNLPLTQIHKQALPAAKAAMCAGEQGQFWATHDGFFKDQESLKSDWQTGFATKYALNVATFNACFAANETEQRVKADAELANKYGITGTPATFIGTVENGGVRVSTVISGANDIESFTKPIDGLLKKN